MTKVNDISVRQNAEPVLQFQAAAQTLYRTAARLFYAQVCFAVLVPVLFAITNLLLPSWSIPRLRREHIAAWFALYGLATLLLDEFLIDPSEQRLKRKAATAQEMFDVELFDLPWNATKVQERLEPSEIEELASRSRATPESAARLVNWYPPVVGNVPIEIGRLICQRTNLWWDSKLRRRYSAGVFSFAIVLTSLAIAGATLFDVTFDRLLISLITVGPAIRWAIREGNRHRSVANRLDALYTRAKAMQKEALDGSLDPEQAKRNSRDLQDAIYDHRASSPIGINWVYKLSRQHNEAGMRVNAEEVVREYHARVNQ